MLLAESLDDFEDLLTASLLLDGRAVGGTRLGAVSNAGFECVALADAMGGLESATFAPDTVSSLHAILSRHRLDGIVAPRNPLDVTPIPELLIGGSVYVGGSGQNQEEAIVGGGAAAFGCDVPTVTTTAEEINRQKCGPPRRRQPHHRRKRHRPHAGCFTRCAGGAP